MTILVTGATGFVGRHVVAQLAEAGERVRAMTRTPSTARFAAGVEVVAGDLDDPSSLVDAVRGVERMYLFPVARTAREVVELAVRAGVRRIVVLSSGAVEAGLDSDFHLPVERAAEDSGVEWTHVRPGEFCSNVLHLWGPSVRAERVVRYPHDEIPSVPVHEADVAAVAVAALLEDGHAGAAYSLTGPEVLTTADKVAAIGAALGEEVRHEEVTRERALELLKAQGGWAAANADFLLGFEPYSEAQEGFTEQELAEMFSSIAPVPGVQQVTGRPARTFAQWACDHVEDFR
ncbi:NAD(P)H-binding protein [Umezawaea beigongshangensis]|uniref:NAD(P)H-binding protein n=1 Tax=Umezawaea beigongshangensis TaxID=2780383 RepID=UPI0018F12B1F|nr:NAD(P)H-binding protein [Umezawaea beigongshangensis]